MPSNDTDDALSNGRPWLWTAAVLLACAPVVAALCLTLWRMPFPISEAVAIFEDVVNQPPARFLTPDTSYYRPLFQIAIGTIWRQAPSLEATLAWIKLLHIVPILVLVLLFIWHLRPRGLLDAAAAAAAVAILVGSPGFRDNLELPLSYTIIGMPLALGAWILLNRPSRAWHQPVIVLLTLVAVGFKEQGLVLVPLIVIAWWTRAPGARGVTAAAVVVMTAAYIVFRFSWRQSWPMFEQAVGFGFGEMEPPEAVARYGSFPYLIYAYSGLSTIANVLFAEPTRGTFSIIRAIVRSLHPEPWQLVHLGSSVGMTAVMAWWVVNASRRAIREGWSEEARLVVTLLVTLLACGVLSFNYSRDRLGGMAVPFYALAAYYAIRSAAAHALQAPRVRCALIGVALMAIVGGWQLRALGTVERTRLTSTRNQTEWFLLLPERRLEFKDRATYLRIMESMIEQGTAQGAPRPTRYPSLLRRFIAELPA